MTELRPCGDCAVEPGQPHQPGCDVARCMWTGLQDIGCGNGLTAACCRALRSSGNDELADALADYLSLDDPDHDCGTDIWTGEYPGLDDARRLNLWCYWGPTWVVCDANHPDADPDLNRLVSTCRWDRATWRWEKRQ